MKISLPPKGARKDYYKKMFFGSNEKRGIIMGIVAMTGVHVFGL